MQEYTKTDEKLHWLSQLLAKTNRAFVPSKEDDSHTNLSFDSIGGRLFGRWIDGQEGAVILTLNLQKRAFEWLDENQNSLDEVTVPEKGMKQLEEDVSNYPESLKMKTDMLFSPLHFEIPDYGIESIEKGDLSDEGLQQWTLFRTLANEACSDMLGYLQKEGEIRIWPHHFDTGIYAMATKQLGLGFGLAMKDAMVGAPYFYLSGYNQETPISYKNLHPLTHGKWETGEQWNGAVLSLGALEGFSKEEAGSIIGTFIQEGINWFLTNTP